MKKLITTLAILTAIATYAEKVPLTISATGYTELLKPQSISYIAAVDAVADDPETVDVDESSPAVPAQIAIKATYQLGYKVPVVDTVIDGVRTVIAPASMPAFNLDITLPVSTFAAFYEGDVAQLVQVLETVGSVTPGDELTETIRSVAFSILSNE